MRKTLSVLAIIIGAVILSNCSSEIDEELDKLAKLGCGPNMPGWPACLDIPPPPPPNQ